MTVEINGIKYLSATEVLETVDVTRQTLWRWRQEGKIPAGHRFRGRQVVFSLEEVTAIQEYANRIEPIDNSDAGQLSLFNGNGLGQKN
ncbi:MAG: helix-turn-helix domain-containing protein [Candidatus Thiodiazotropha endolucinida]|nr:helix-turn-helix domain-containing protein [Candidatus Thiodiazotropha taylori]